MTKQCKVKMLYNIVEMFEQFKQKNCLIKRGRGFYILTSEVLVPFIP